VIPPGREGVLNAILTAAAAPAPARIDVTHGEEGITLEGSIRIDETDTLTFASPTPVLDATEAWISALRRAGITINGPTVVRWLPEPDSTYLPGPSVPPPPGTDTPIPCALPVRLCPGGTLLLTFESPPITAIVKGMLEPSQNWIAEQLLRALGREYGENGRASDGIAVAESFLFGAVGVDSAAVEMRDGSGLSAYNLVTPRALVDILRYAQTQPWALAFRDGLAAPGEEGSTLESRLEPLAGRMEGKTGTITHVNALSGYVRRTDGREIVFAILTNGSGLPSATVRRAMDDVVAILAGSR